nr:hypothetical protein CFP56_26028 [Quercus suber]
MERSGLERGQICCTSELGERTETYTIQIRILQYYCSWTEGVTDARIAGLVDDIEHVGKGPSLPFRSLITLAQSFETDSYSTVATRQTHWILHSPGLPYLPAECLLQDDLKIFTQTHSLMTSKSHSDMNGVAFRHFGAYSLAMTLFRLQQIISAEEYQRAHCGNQQLADMYSFFNVCAVILFQNPVVRSLASEHEQTLAFQTMYLGSAQLAGLSPAQRTRSFTLQVFFACLLAQQLFMEFGVGNLEC